MGSSLLGSRSTCCGLVQFMLPSFEVVVRFSSESWYSSVRAFLVQGFEVVVVNVSMCFSSVVLWFMDRMVRVCIWFDCALVVVVNVARWLWFMILLWFGGCGSSMVFSPWFVWFECGSVIMV